MGYVLWTKGKTTISGGAGVSMVLDQGEHAKEKHKEG